MEQQTQLTLRFDITSNASLVSPPFTDPLDARRSAFKAYLIQRYCAEGADAEIISQFFELLPELVEA